MLKRTIPILIASLSGALLVFSYFFPATEKAGEIVADWFNVMAAVAFVLGAGNLLLVNLERISSQRPGWAYSAITILSFAAMLAFGMLKIGAVPDPRYPDVHFAGSYDSPASPFGWFYEHVFSPLGATMFALLAFYVASAAFRAFRAKNIESILLLGTAFIILLAQTWFSVLTAWIPADGMFGFLRLDSMRTGITEYIQTAGMRAITIGIALGVIATGIRVIVGLDKSYLARD